jgi:hypothetical protein
MPDMTILKALRFAAGAAVLALTLWGLLAAPGFLSDQDSSAAAQQGLEARR